MVKEKGVYNKLVRECIKLFRHFMGKISLDRSSQNKEEKFLFPFLLKWLQGRCGSLLKNEFDEVYRKKGWIPTYNERMLHNDNTIPFYFMESLNKALDLIDKNHLGYKEKYSPKEEGYYKNILYAYYCLYYYNADLLFHRNIQYKIIRIFRIVEVMIKDEVLYDTYKKISVSLSPDEKNALQRNFHKENSYNTIWMAISAFQDDIISIEDIVLQYKVWKADKELNPDLLERGLFYSLCLRFSENGIREKQAFVSCIYYWYYGFVEGHYAEIIFAGLHGEYGSEEKKLLSRLLALEEDKGILKYLQKKYTIYCNKKQIPANKQIESLKTVSDNESLDNESKNPQTTKDIPLQLEMAKGFNDGKISCLSGLLADLKLISVDDKIKLSYFLGSKKLSIPQKKYLIVWHGTYYSLKYFIDRYYKSRGIRVANNTWKKVCNTFIVVDKKVEAGSLSNSKSYSNLPIKKCKEQMGEDLVKFIDECIDKALNATIRK